MRKRYLTLLLSLTMLLSLMPTAAFAAESEEDQADTAAILAKDPGEAAVACAGDGNYEPSSRTFPVAVANMNSVAVTFVDATR